MLHNLQHQIIVKVFRLLCCEIHIHLDISGRHGQQGLKTCHSRPSPQLCHYDNLFGGLIFRCQNGIVILSNVYRYLHYIAFHTLSPDHAPLQVAASIILNRCVISGYTAGATLIYRCNIPCRRLRSNGLKVNCDRDVFTRHIIGIPVKPIRNLCQQTRSNTVCHCHSAQSCTDSYLYIRLDPLIAIQPCNHCAVCIYGHTVITHPGFVPRYAAGVHNTQSCFIASCLLILRDQDFYVFTLCFPSTRRSDVDHPSIDHILGQCAVSLQTPDGKPDTGVTGTALSVIIGSNGGNNAIIRFRYKFFISCTSPYIKRILHICGIKELRQFLIIKVWHINYHPIATHAVIRQQITLLGSRTVTGPYHSMCRIVGPLCTGPLCKGHGHLSTAHRHGQNCLASRQGQRICSAICSHFRRDYIIVFPMTRFQSQAIPRLQP